MEPAVAEAVEMGLEPQLRARSNTWPAVPRLADDFGDSGSGGAGGGLLGGADMKGPPPPVAGGPIPAHLKKNSSRRNAWGNLSYADLITQAIGSAPDKRLTLAQIYEWMVHNVAYFKDKGDSNSSAGWKNSIRHNLSLHNRFMRVQNEGTGKSSWWMINPDAKPGKSARRRATSMETSKFEKRRGRVKKKVEALRNGLDATPSPSSSVSESLDLFPESPLHGFQLSPDFRPRTSSNASSCGGRLSPIPAVDTDWGYYGPEQLAGNLEQTMRLGQQQQQQTPTNSPPQQQPAAPPQQQVVGVAAVSGPANGGPPGSGGGGGSGGSGGGGGGGGGVAAASAQILTGGGPGSGGPATPELPPSAFIYPQPPPPPYRPAPPYSNLPQCPIHRNHTHSCPPSCPIAPKQRINYMEGADQSAATMMGQLMGALNPSMLDDLNINIETIPGFDCNVDEVIKHELSLEGSLDFNFSAGGQPPPGSHPPPHTQEQTSPFSGHPWVH